MNARTSIARHNTGLVAASQGSLNGFRMSYNPDDGRFRVDAPDGADWINRATFAGNEKGWANARHWARTHQAE